MTGGNDLLFDVETPLGFRVRVTRARWELIVSAKHPAMVDREVSVQAALQSPDEVHQSRTDSAVFLFYKAEQAKRWVCAVAKQRSDAGFLITAYPTDTIKEGVKVWPK